MAIFDFNEEFTVEKDGVKLTFAVDDCKELRVAIGEFEDDVRDECDDNDFSSFEPDRAPEIQKEDVRALEQAVRLGDRLEAEALLDRIFAPMDMAEAVDLGRYNSVTAKAAGRTA